MSLHHKTINPEVKRKRILQGKSSNYQIGILSLLALAFISGENHRKPIPPPLAPYGHVQWLKIKTYNAGMDSSGYVLKAGFVNDTNSWFLPIAPPVPMEYIEYDEYGNQVEEDKYHTNGKLYRMVLHKYYPNGDIKEVIDSLYRSRNKTSTVKIGQNTYVYDSKDNLLESNQWNYPKGMPSQEPSFIRIQNVYNANEQLLEEFTFIGDTVNPRGLKLYRYNEQGQLSEIDHSKTKPGETTLTPTIKEDFKYDIKGNEIDKSTYSFHRGITGEVKTTYDNAGKTVETTSYEGNNMVSGSTVKRTFYATHTVQEDVYDGAGQLTDYTIYHYDSAKHLLDEGVFHINYPLPRGSEAYNPNGKADTIMVHHLVNDDHFNTVEDDIFTNEGRAISHKSYQYSYDNTGNWIERIYFEDNKPVYVTDREIGYFK